MNLENEISDLNKRIDLLNQRHGSFSREISDLYTALYKLKNLANEQEQLKETIVNKYQNLVHFNHSALNDNIEVKALNEQKEKKNKATIDLQSFNLEKFIGENLINKIGILITIIGVGVGTKYSIDHQLISPLTRIVLGYLFSTLLLLFGFFLKKKYLNYSSVLVSGAVACMYFISYSSFAFYDLYDIQVAFFLMLIFTVFTILASLYFNRQIIAIVGLVGAYAVPFLLSSGEGNILFFFTYILCINLGLLIISIYKYWIRLFYISFLFTWLIFLSWHFSKTVDSHFVLGSVFSSLFFILFYTVFIAYKYYKEIDFKINDIILLSLNSFVYFLAGYSLLVNESNWERYLGMFTLLNAFVHLAFCYFVSKKKQFDPNLIYFLGGLVISFVTLSIPVQLNGNWVTLLWVFEATIFAYIGSKYNIKFYNKLFLAFLIISTLSLIDDWSFYETKNLLGRNFTWPILNLMFLSVCCFVSCLVLIIKFLNNRIQKFNLNESEPVFTWLLLIKVLVVFIVFGLGISEINYLGYQMYYKSQISIPYSLAEYGEKYVFNKDIINYTLISEMIYGLVFIIIGILLNHYKYKNKHIALTSVVMTFLLLTLFLTLGLLYIGELRMHYIVPSIYYNASLWNVFFRYVPILIIVFLLYLLNFIIKQDYCDFKIQSQFQIYKHFVILVLCSNEFISIAELLHFDHVFKLNLSILWAVYSLYMISIGIYKRDKITRVAGMLLFAVTLLKLFFYDITQLSMISKTFILVSLGVILLFISFLYNKFKHLIESE
jgi:hypothetical protein